jgi:hypothetical protein
MQESLIFLVSAPRSGSTLLARMLGAHSAIAAGPEAHLVTPLAHLGFFERVDAAPYDPVISQEGIRELVARLPAGEESYVDACRAYADVLYQRLLETQPGCSRVLDKTPAYALVLPFLVRLYPRARYVVLTRTPPAVLASQATSFFDGDFATAVRHNPVLERYVPAIARFLRERPVEAVHVRYEDLVRDPATELGRVCEHLGLPFEDAVIEYGRSESDSASVTGARGLGDPNVTQHARPVTDFLESWVTDIAGDPERLRITRDCLAGLDPRDIETWGYSVREIEDALEKADTAPVAAHRSRRPRLSRYNLERKLLVALRRNIHTNWLGRLVRRVRLYCDVLLR